ncbi:hypothetical protein EDB80DRAFT_268174 [Ilyonectria destructans]|nr:hypothetical protein EDB80DRAFT_268174 [Ilyonectria destructans]
MPSRHVPRCQPRPTGLRHRASATNTTDCTALPVGSGETFHPLRYVPRIQIGRGRNRPILLTVDQSVEALSRGPVPGARPLGRMPFSYFGFLVLPWKCLQRWTTGHPLPETRQTGIHESLDVVAFDGFRDWKGGGKKKSDTIKHHERAKIRKRKQRSATPSVSYQGLRSSQTSGEGEASQRH